MKKDMLAKTYIDCPQELQRWKILMTLSNSAEILALVTSDNLNQKQPMHGRIIIDHD
jgi:hypothetical protein